MPHEKHTSRPSIVSWTQVAIAAALLTPFSAAEAARSAKLDWKPSKDSDVAGYRVHYGTTRGKHDKIIDAASATSVAIPNLSDDSTYYFVVTAYNRDGLESEPSKEMSVGANAAASAPATQATSPDATDSKVTDSNATATSTPAAVATPTTAVSTPAPAAVTVPTTNNSKATATTTTASTTEPTTATSAPATATVAAPATADSKSVATTTAPSITASAAKKARNGKLAWKPSKDADVAGYRVHYGATRGKHDKTIDAGTATSASLPNLSNGNAYYAVVTAYNHAGLESKPSDEISVEANATASAPATQATSADTTAPATSDSTPAATTPSTTTPSTAAAPATAPSTTASAAYTAWSAQIPSEKDRAATADADGDGLSNLLEYALGRSAATAESAAPLKLTREGNKLTVSYSHPVDRSDVRCELQVSHDLNSWVTVPDTQRTTTSGSGERVYERNIAGIDRLFFRLNVNGAGASESTAPAGVINTKIAGANGSSAAAGTSVIGVGLTQFAAYRGTAETVDKNTLGDAQAKWTEGQFEGSNGAYVLEITSGPAAGTTYDVAKTSAQSLTLTQPLASGVTSGVTFEIRKQWTLGSIFGAKNEAGLGGGSSTTADLVQIRNGDQYDTYYYQTTGEGGVGWRKQGDPSTDQANVVVYQEDGITIKRKQAQPAQLAFVGAVKQGKTSIPVFQGENVIANVYSAPITLAGSGLYTGNPATGLASGSETTADQVLMWNGAKYDTYYYSTQGGWKKIGAANDAGKAQIPVGGAVTIVRKAAEGFNWIAPQPNSKEKSE